MKYPLEFKNTPNDGKFENKPGKFYRCKLNSLSGGYFTKDKVYLCVGDGVKRFMVNNEGLIIHKNKLFHKYWEEV